MLALVVLVEALEIQPIPVALVHKQAPVLVAKATGEVTEDTTPEAEAEALELLVTIHMEITLAVLVVQAQLQVLLVLLLLMLEAAEAADILGKMEVQQLQTKTAHREALVVVGLVGVVLEVTALVLEKAVTV
jgi:hypothetical protein